MAHFVKLSLGLLTLTLLAFFVPTQSYAQSPVPGLSAIREAAIACGESSTALEPAPPLDRRILIRGFIKPPACVQRLTRDSEDPEMLELRDEIWEMAKNNPNRYKEGIALLEAMTEASLTGFIERDLYTLYNNYAKGDEREAGMKRWAEAVVRKAPAMAPAYGNIWATGTVEKANVTADKDFALKLLRMGLTTGCVYCVEVVHFNKWTFPDGTKVKSSFNRNELALIQVLKHLQVDKNQLSGYNGKLPPSKLPENPSPFEREFYDLQHLAYDTFGGAREFPLMYTLRDHYKLGLIDVRYLEMLALAQRPETEDLELTMKAHWVKGDARAAALQMALDDIDAFTAGLSNDDERKKYEPIRNWYVTLSAGNGDPQHIGLAADIIGSMRAVRWYDYYKKSFAPMSRGLVTDQTKQAEPVIMWASMVGELSDSDVRQLRANAWITASALCFREHMKSGTNAIQKWCSEKLKTAKSLAPNDRRVVSLQSTLSGMQSADAAAWEQRFSEARAFREKIERDRANRRANFNWGTRQSFVSTQEWQAPASGLTSAQDIYKTHRERGVLTCQRTGGSNCGR